MRFNWRDFLFHFALKPREAGSHLLNFKLTNIQLIQLSVLAICLLTIFRFLIIATYGSSLTDSIDMQNMQSNQMEIFQILKLITPINIVYTLFILFLARAVALTFFGRMFGGRGTFRETVLFLASFDIIHSILLAILFISLWVLPVIITDIFMLLGSILMVWISTNLIQVLHKFNNLMFVFFGLIAGYLSLAVFFLFIVLVFSK